MAKITINFVAGSAPLVRNGTAKEIRPLFEEIKQMMLRGETVAVEFEPDYFVNPEHIITLRYQD